MENPGVARSFVAGQNQIGLPDGRGINELCKGLSVQTQLTRLDLSNCQLSGDAVGPICTVIRGAPLKHLDLRWNPLPPFAATKFLEAVRALRTAPLVELNLEGCRQDDHSLAQIGRLLKENHYLKHDAAPTVLTKASHVDYGRDAEAEPYLTERIVAREKEFERKIAHMAEIVQGYRAELEQLRDEKRDRLALIRQRTKALTQMTLDSQEAGRDLDIIAKQSKEDLGKLKDQKNELDRANDDLRRELRQRVHDLHQLVEANTEARGQMGYVHGGVADQLGHERETQYWRAVA
eukprot:CAMPEP_0204370274 /NCGR_PEP_ID=MMETSP0469-20131031/45621_1 /ASSEMBLY_ACC=CAM_ASM_000384 /TAXON_ID=2969 /ORGANISM="Oxyrrhis marina" /LENGTH=291 /DNA_ID=CAMNT_0051360177 /DNA_START=1 /DNA_END=876 /DNA_ORIENTATION=-